MTDGTRTVPDAVVSAIALKKEKSMMANSYSLMEWHGKWDVVKSTPDSIVKFYLRNVRNGATVWYTDQLYARHYSKETAMRHLRNLRASDPDCDEDF